MKAAVIKAAAIAALIAAAAANPAQAQEESAAAAESSTTIDSAGTTSTTPNKSGTTLLNTNTTTPVTTSTASLPAAVQAAAPRKIFAEFYSETYIDMTDIEHGEGDATLNSYIGPKFDLGNTNSLSVRQNFDYIAGNGSGDFKIQDLVLNFTRGKLAEFKDGTTLTLIARAYVPYGQTSRNNDSHGQERLYLIGSKSIGKFDLTYVLMGRYFQPGRDFNSSVNDDGETTYTTFNQGHVANEVDLFYNVNQKVAVGMIVGYDNYFKTAAPGKPRQTDDIYFQPVLQVAPVKGVTMQAMLANEIQVRQPKHTHFRAFRGDETQVSFNIAAQL